jgi:hypothetical protein
MSEELIQITVDESSETVQLNVQQGPDPVITFVQETLITAGDGGLKVYTAGEDVGSGKVVYMNAGKVYLFDPSNPSLYGKILGITKTAALANDNVQVFIGGIATVSGWGLTPGANYYVISNGNISTVPPTGSLQERIGSAIDANNLLINKNSIITIN